MISSVLSDTYKSIGVWNKEDKRNKDEEINFAKTIHSWHTNIDVQDRKYAVSYTHLMLPTNSRV